MNIDNSKPTFIENAMIMSIASKMGAIPANQSIKEKLKAKIFNIADTMLSLISSSYRERKIEMKNKIMLQLENKSLPLQVEQRFIFKKPSNQQEQLASKSTVLEKSSIDPKTSSKEIIQKQQEQIDIFPIIPQSPHHNSNHLRTYVDNDEIPYFLNRKGFPNPSARNCGPNSLAVLYAHTGRSIPLIHPANKKLYEDLANPDNFEEILHQNILKLEQQLSSKKEDLENINKQIAIEKSSIEEKLKSFEIKKIEEELEISKKEYEELSGLIQATFDESNSNFAKSLHILSEKLSLEKQEYIKLKLEREINKTNIVSEAEKEKEKSVSQLEVRANLLQQRVNHFIERHINEAKSLIQTAIEAKKNLIIKKEKELEQKKSDIQAPCLAFEISKKNLENEIENINYNLLNFIGAKENQAKLPIGVKILATLRGEIEGNLTMQDAQLLNEIINTPMGQTIYTGSKEAHIDINKIKLKEALYNSNWRGLQVGGYGHWWVYS